MEQKAGQEGSLYQSGPSAVQILNDFKEQSRRMVRNVRSGGFGQKDVDALEGTWLNISIINFWPQTRVLHMNSLIFSSNSIS